MRILVLSDLHVDAPANLAIVRGFTRPEFGEDILIVAGDVSHRFARLAETLAHLRDNFRLVCFVAGNHDLWKRDGGHENSLERLQAIDRLCYELEVIVRPTEVGHGAEAVRIVPVISWYTKAGEGPDTLYRPGTTEAFDDRDWADDVYVVWPDLGQDPPSHHLLSLNEPAAPVAIPTISFSHFLPRQDLIFPLPREAARPNAGFNFSNVAGTSRLEERVRALGSAVHVYGHQHRDRSRFIDNIWYVSHCLGYPRERGDAVGVDKQPRTIWENGSFTLAPLQPSAFEARPRR